MGAKGASDWGDPTKAGPKWGTNGNKQLRKNRAAAQAGVPVPHKTGSESGFRCVIHVNSSVSPGAVNAS